MKTFKSLFLLLLFLGLAGCGGNKDSSSGGGEGETTAETTTEDAAPALERTIVVIGDSIGIGFNASFAFPDLLERLTGIPVINVSKGGSSAEFGASRYYLLSAVFGRLFPPGKHLDT